MNNNKVIIITTSSFLFLSFIFLSLVEKKQSDMNAANVWTIYFENPKDNSLDFGIENHSTDTNFHWQVLSDKAVAKQGDIVIKTGETKKVPAALSDALNKKITISVASGNNKKEIYKNF